MKYAIKNTLYWLAWRMPPSCPLCSPGNALQFNACYSRNAKQRYLVSWLWESSVEPGELTEQEAGTFVHPVPVFWTCHHCCLPPVLSPTDWFPAAWHMTGMRGTSRVRAVAVGTRWCWRQSVSIQRWLEQVHKWMVLTLQRNVVPLCTEVKHSKKNTRMFGLWNGSRCDPLIQRHSITSQKTHTLSNTTVSV